MSIRTRILESTTLIIAVGLASFTAGVGAQVPPSPMNLARAPLFLNASVEPNVAVTLDDSGSMEWGYIPDTAPNNCGARHPRYFSSVFNRIYYNPLVRYTPPLGPNGVPFANASFTAAWYDGYEAVDALNPGDNRQGSRVVDLRTQYFPQRTMPANRDSTTTWPGDRIGHDPRLRPVAPDLTLVTNLGTADQWFNNCTNPAAPVPAVPAVDGNNAWLPFTSANNQATGTFFTGTTGGTSAAFYYQFRGNPAVAAEVNDPRRYEAVDMRAQPADQQQNFANWYSYYRTRVLMSRTALSRTFGVQDPALRVVMQNLWGNAANPLFAAGTTTFNRFDGAVRTAFFNRLYRSPASGNTPNRIAMIRAGSLFQYGAGVTNNTNPYWEGAPLSRELTCRQNFHIQLTDGYTNETTNPTLSTLVSGVQLSSALTLPDSRAYTPGAAASRIVSNVLTPAASCGGAQCDPSLARVAFAYWATDLRPDLTNNVPPFFPDRRTGITGTALPVAPANPADSPEIYWNPENNPATWQHMANFTVGLGVSGRRNFPGDFVGLRTGVVAWPGLVNLAPEAVDDLWHAGLVSRGGYYSAADPQELVDSLSAALSSVVARRGTASAATVTSGIIQASTLAFRTGFDSGDWTGQVLAYRVGSDGRVVEPPVWEAGSILDSRTADSRVILTASDHDGGGIPFRWASLPAAYQASLNDNPQTGVIDDDGLGEKRLDYIRGDRTQEINNGGPFRIRAGLLGSIVNSGAVVVAAPAAAFTDESFPGGPEASASVKYAEFRSDNKDRRRVIYVGGNAGMMHAFDAGTGRTGFDAGGNPIVDFGTGEELWAYVPREVAPNLSRLTNDVFEFTPYVDNSPVVRDVFINGQWRTILVGSLRRGGQGIFALDITNPAVTEAGAADVVLWEFSDDLDSRLGFTYGRPNISRLANGKWVIVVPGGYNSEAPPPPNDGGVGGGGSSLFVLDAADGSLIRRFDFTAAESRGLSTPTMGDYESDFIDEFAVAGDLQGNLWRFDLSNPNPALWTRAQMFDPPVEFNQPITSAPRLFPDPKTGGIIAVFSTGKYLEPSDRSLVGVPTQRLYGVRDYGATPPTGFAYPATEANLQAQTLTKNNATTPPTFTVTNNNLASNQRGWRINLVDQGERGVTSAGALFSQGIAIFSTVIPNGDDPCLPGLRGNVYVLNASSGAAPAIDRNADGVINAADLAAPVGQAVSSSVAEGSPALLVNVGGGYGTLIDFPEIRVPTTVWRRRSWREITAED